MPERAPGTGLTRCWLAGLVAGAAIANVVRTTVLPGAAHFPFNLAVGGAAVGVALGAGLSARELGLRREDLGRGLRYGGAVVGVGVLAVGTAVVVPPLADLLVDDRADVTVGAMAWRALVVIPLGTVLVEELLFRGTLLGLLLRLTTPARAIVAMSGLFGLWHVLPAGEADGVVVAAGTFVATSVAGLGFGWLRVRSGSLAAPVLAHLTTNSVVYVGAWLASR